MCTGVVPIFSLMKPLLPGFGFAIDKESHVKLSSS